MIVWMEINTKHRVADTERTQNWITRWRAGEKSNGSPTWKYFFYTYEAFLFLTCGAIVIIKCAKWIMKTKNKWNNRAKSIGWFLKRDDFIAETLENGYFWMAAINRRNTEQIKATNVVTVGRSENRSSTRVAGWMKSRSGRTENVPSLFVSHFTNPPWLWVINRMPFIDQELSVIARYFEKSAIPNQNHHIWRKCSSRRY